MTGSGSPPIRTAPLARLAAARRLAERDATSMPFAAGRRPAARSAGPRSTGHPKTIILRAAAVPSAGDVERAREAIADVVRPTPLLPSAALSERCGAPVALKAESLQRTGSFKIRGALAKLHALGDDCAPGVVTGSAGNHAQALAAAAQARGVRCEVFMPVNAPLGKIEGATALGAEVHLAGETVDDCIAAARERAEETGMGFVHPFDDADVV